MDIFSLKDSSGNLLLSFVDNSSTDKEFNVGLPGSGTANTNIFMECDDSGSYVAINSSPINQISMYNPAPGTGDVYSQWMNNNLNVFEAHTATNTTTVSQQGCHLNLTPTEINANKPVLLPTYAFSAIPASPVTGWEINVSDSSVNTWGTAITGGGTFNVKARYNGTAWTVTGI